MNNQKKKDFYWKYTICGFEWTKYLFWLIALNEVISQTLRINYMENFKVYPKKKSWEDMELSTEKYIELDECYINSGNSKDINDAKMMKYMNKMK
tara:strand:- start:12528 stop:12812 length:285 start_codon:yes stop_codon:yes gene_type:complete